MELPEFEFIRVESSCPSHHEAEERADYENRIAQMHQSGDKILDLSGISLKEFPTELLAFTTLEQIDISKTLLVDLPEAFAHFAHLKQLNLAYTEIEELPRSIFSLTDLEVLDLSNCRLTTLPEEFNSLTALKTIRLEGCLMRQFPDVLYQLPQLQEIDFSYQGVANSICTIGQPLPQLAHFNLAGNKQPRINVPLEQLEYLNLAHCSLSSLEDILINTPNVKKINLLHNSLTTLPDSFSRLSQLEELTISLGSVDHCALEILKSLPNLQTIHLDNNDDLVW